MLQEYENQKKTLVSIPFVIPGIIDSVHNAKVLADTGCNTMGLIDRTYVRRNKLQRVEIPARDVYTYDDKPSERILAIVRAQVDVGGVKDDVWMYEVSKMKDQNIILGTPWMKRLGVVIDVEENRLIFKNHGVSVSAVLPDSDIRHIGANAFKLLYHRSKARKEEGLKVFAVSLADIEKALKPKTHGDPKKLLPPQYHQYLGVFDRQEAEILPPLRGEGIDHKIELVPGPDGKDPKVPFGPMYGQTREELLVLRKTLHDYLSKGFIRVSNSPAASPVLFVKKPGGGLRFCVDYRALNAITRKDRYPLPLINETLERIGKATWFTKVDVISAFHKIRIAEGSEWLTAFRTRYGLYEWLVTPFGLVNAPSTFQKYINWAIREFLDEFASAYLDDVLIFTTGSLAKHRKHVSLVLDRLQKAGIYLDIDKCEFEVQSTKYLGFIIDAGKGIRMDPEKIKAIEQWEAPTTVRAVRGFIGFANFYRRFIKDFSKTAAPLIELTKKDVKFNWSEAADNAFKKMKQLFTTAPVLMHFDPDRETVVEVDSSGYVIGGLLQQYDDNGALRPCAFFSQKNSPAECNYQIYDKELLAIVKCLREWRTELMSAKQFTVITDHKNLTYFTTSRKLQERQMRWAEELSQFNFHIQYRPGKEGTQPDELSRREQDLPKDADPRYQHREMTLLQKDLLVGFPEVSALRVCSIGRVSSVEETESDLGPARNLEHKETGIGEAARDSKGVAVDDGLERAARDSIEDQWLLAKEKDALLKEITTTVQEGARKLPHGVKVSISECEVKDDNLLFRGRRWVPDYEPLRTRIIQETHDSPLAGHPGRETTYALVSRKFYWPNMSQDIRRFCQNCDRCRANHVWRDKKHGLLKPLPVPLRKWKDVSVDFIVELPMSDDCTNIMVITDRLTRGVILTPMKEITADAMANVFLTEFYRRHGLPESIVSDRGSAFISKMWKRVCQLLNIKRRLSTAWHPETDGSTERLNAVVEDYLRQFTCFQQSDWKMLLPSCELALNNRPATSTGVSPFFLMHGYDLDVIQLSEPVEDRAMTSPIAKGDAIAKKLSEALEFAQAALASSLERQEFYANQHRQAAPLYRPGDMVWLDLRNVKTQRPSKKLDEKYAKYTVLEAVGSHAYRLNTPPGIHPVFHTWLLRPVIDDPLPSQKRSDPQPPALLISDGDDGEDSHEEWSVERILDERTRRVGRGSRKEVLVKWVGYQRPTWEPRSALEETAALDAWERQQSGLTLRGEGGG